MTTRKNSTYVVMTQAELDAGAGDSLSADRIVIVDAANVPTGAVYDSGAAGESPAIAVTEANINTALQSAGGAQFEDWAATTEVKLHQVVTAPSAVGTVKIGDLLRSNSARTTGATFDASELTNWTEVSSDPVQSVAGKTGVVVLAIADTPGLQAAIDLKAPIASPAFTGTPAVPTAAVDTNTTQAASTAWVSAQLSGTLPLMNGSATVGSGTRSARGNHVHPTDTSRASTAVATTAVDGLMAAADKAKLDTAPSKALVNQGEFFGATKGTRVITPTQAAVAVSGSTTISFTDVSGMAIGDRVALDGDAWQVISAINVSTNVVTVSPASSWNKGIGVVIAYDEIGTGQQVARLNALSAADVGLTNVNNTADSAKPVSTAQQTALDGKSDTVHTHASDATKQDLLSSGNNIKTINNQSIVGPGNIAIASSTDAPTRPWDSVTDFSTGDELQMRSGGLPSTGAIATWNDESGNARNFAQATPANQPNATTQLNSLPIATFATDDYLANAASLTLKPVTFISLFRSTTTGVLRTLIGSSTNGLQFLVGDTNRLRVTQTWVSVIGNATTVLAADTWYLGVATYSAAGVLAFRLNGATDGSTTNDLVIGASSYDIGRNKQGGGEYWNGNIAELLVYNSVLSDANLQLIEGYIMHKFGLQANLAVGHPYLTTAPTVVELPIYADNTAAIAGGLAVGKMYRTSAGALNVRY